MNASPSSGAAAAAAAWPPGSAQRPAVNRTLKQQPVPALDVSVKKLTSTIQSTQAVAKIQALQSRTPPLEPRKPPQLPLTRPSSQQNVLNNHAATEASSRPPPVVAPRPVPPRPASLNKQTQPAAAAAVAGRKPPQVKLDRPPPPLAVKTVSPEPLSAPTATTVKQVVVEEVKQEAAKPTTPPQSAPASPSPPAPTTRKSMFSAGLATVFAGVLKKSTQSSSSNNFGDDESVASSVSGAIINPNSKAYKEVYKQLISVHVSPENADKYTMSLFKEGFDHKSKLQFLEEQDLLHCGITSRGDIKAILSLVVNKPMEPTKSESKLLLQPSVSSRSNQYTAIAANGQYSKHVMLSFNVRTLGDFANMIHFEMIKNKKTHCWSCTQSIQVGQEWRDSIQVAVEQCTHFVMLINSEWINSGECQHEYKIALSLYNKLKQPKMFPIVFPSGRKHLESGMGLGIAANFNCLFLEDEDATVEARQAAAIKSVVDFLT